MPKEDMRALSLFSGIGGLDIAASWAGIETAAFCEIEPYPVEILKRRWPDVPILPDVREIDGRDWSVDVVHGGFPCQDLSVAGKQVGLSGERSGLWFEMLRVISECRPRFVVAENVRGAVNLALDTVVAGLEGEGYKVRPLVLPASAFGAPHQRERLFVVGVRADVADSLNERFQGGERGFSFLEPGASAHEPASQCGEGGGSLWPTPTVGTSGGVKLCGGSGHWEMLKAGVGIDEARKMGAGNGGQLNPDWVECLMGYPLGWTDVDCETPEPWPGWPALMGERVWGTHTATFSVRSPKFISDSVSPSEFVAKGMSADQYPYEPPRTVTGCRNRAKRLKCLGNSVVPQQAYPIFRAIAYLEEVSA